MISDALRVDYDNIKGGKNSIPDVIDLGGTGNMDSLYALFGKQ